MTLLAYAIAATAIGNTVGLYWTNDSQPRVRLIHMVSAVIGYAIAFAMIA